MMNIIVEGSRPNKQPSKEKTRIKSQHSPPKVEYKGITVKQYFRLCDEAQKHNIIQQIKQQSSQQSQAQTPAFGTINNQRVKHKNIKMKTQVQQLDDVDVSFIKKQSNNNIANYPYLAQKLSSTMGQKHIKTVNQKKPERTKRIVSIPSKNSTQFLNQSTLSSFYKMNKNKKNILNKLKKQKQKLNDVKFSDAFLITKYGSKFNLDHNVK